MTAPDLGETGRWWRSLSRLWLGLLVPSLVFSNGRWQIAAAALAAPFLTRLFLMSQPVARGLFILAPLQAAAYLVMWWEVIPAPGILYYIIAGAYGLCYLLPFVVDRIVSPRIQGFASTLVLPLSWYLTEILIQYLSPYGSWSSVGYTQMDHGLFLPLAAWVGVAGVAFVTVWIASVAAWTVMTTLPLNKRSVALTLWASPLLLLVLLARATPGSQSLETADVTVAAITPANEATIRVSQAVLAAQKAGDFSDEHLARLRLVTAELNAGLLRRSRLAAENGARLVVWSETAGRVLGAREDQLIARGQELARDAGIYLFMGLGVLHPGRQPPFENKVVAITPSGEIAWQYQKARPIVGSEAPFLPPGHDVLATLDADFGKIGLVICHDLDFADFVTQAGRRQVELMLAPSADWPVIADLHAGMGVMRAIENGFWLLRPAHDGLSVIASPRGQVTASVYDAALASRVFVGRIPVARIRTVYPHIRPFLVVIAAALLVGMLIIAGRSRPS